ncbi:hypothetical protein PDESU_02383 [Pontiella desulfatans]|uniref:PLAT domain-containing protein n=1 Tax=Pontiella desulfatans TaxID=2750659 RepID=A0A6C2U391_PONDE|nr:hypothetical protein [Pontiella desulfatans]VGO13826.1 hypothetical protein PDESU_02383 [Pontiella desulfatans]
MKTSMFLLTMAAVALSAGAAQAAAPKVHPVRIQVMGQLEKDRDSTKNESERSSSKSKTETQFYELQITLANTIKQEGAFDLEWYFFKRPLDGDGNEGDPVICEKGKTTMELGGMKRATHPVKSGTLTWSETKTSKTSSGNSNSNNSGSSSSKSVSGDVYDGYLVVARKEGEIIKTYASDKKYMDEKWLTKLDDPVEAGRKASKGASSKKKKKEK